MYKFLMYALSVFALFGVIDCNYNSSMTVTLVEGSGSVTPETEVWEYSREWDYDYARITFLPDEGYRFHKWEVYKYSQLIYSSEQDGLDYGRYETLQIGDGGFELSFWVTQKTEYSVLVYAKPITSDLNISIEGEGTVEENVLGSKSYDTGSKIELEARPAEGWSFDRWKGVELEDNTAPVITLSLDEDLDVTAIFKPNTVNIEMIKNENGGYWKILDADDQYLRSSDDVNNIIRDIPEGSVIKLVGTNSSEYAHTGWEIHTNVSSTFAGTYKIGHTKEYTIPYGAGKVEVKAKFQTTEVLVPGGGVFNVNNFSEFIGDLFPVFKGGYDLFKSRHNWNGLTLESTVLDAYYIGKGGNDVFKMNHHYAPEGYIDYSTFGDYKWTYTYNNLGKISAIGFDDGSKNQELTVAYGSLGESRFTFLAFLGDNVFGFYKDEESNKAGSYVQPLGGANFIYKGYTLDDDEKALTVTMEGSPEAQSYELSAQFEYDSEGKRSKATYSDGAVADYVYEGLTDGVSVGRMIQGRSEGKPSIFQNIVIGEETYQTISQYSTRDGIYHESRDSSNKIVERNFGNPFTYVSMSLTVQKLDIYGRIIKGDLEVSYNINNPAEKVSYKGYFEVVDGKAAWKDADGVSLSSDEVPDWMRQLTQVLDDDKPHSDFYFAYDELYYR